MPPVEAPLARLERALIDEFIRARGYDPAKLSELSGEARDRLLKDASLHASARLSEMEARLRLLEEIHDTSERRGD